MEVYALFGQHEDPYLFEDLLGIYHTKEDAEFHYDDFLINNKQSSLYYDYSIKKVVIGARAKHDHPEV